ncbi:MAG TPA: zinc-binding dehydrogenase [Acidimicrobiales bacterium]|nr:zinc-binding dehydrogenase [Acidimicrobiales bacterium]
MHAIRQHAFGPPENLLYEEVDDPKPGPGQVRIAVAAAGVHFIDASIRRGQSPPSNPVPELLMIPGREVAGVVDVLGDGVDEAWRGRRVVAHLGPSGGGYAELAVAAAEALHELPEGLAFDAAVAMIGTGRTAVGILRAAKLQADDVVLVTAAAGGMGALFVQEARNVGAVAVGVAGGPAKVDLAEQLGADVAVDYSVPGWTQTVRDRLEGREVTVALDGVGGDLGRDALRLLGLGGRMILFGWSSGTPLEVGLDVLYTGGVSLMGVLGPWLMRQPGGIRALEDESLAAAASGRLEPLVGPPFALSEAAAAHIALETRATVGKTVLVPDRVTMT